jgi:uncharacterized protein (TIGR02444 family)
VLLPLRSILYSTNRAVVMDRNTIGRNERQAMPESVPERDAGAAFWRFSLALYARPGVAGALIALQDRAGLDVNLILFGLWVGARHGFSLESGDFAAAADAVAEPNGVVREIRALRRRLDDGTDEEVRRLRRALLRGELAAERQVQRRFAGWFTAAGLPGASGDRRAASHANLARCLGEESESPEAAVLRRQLAALMRSV